MEIMTVEEFKTWETDGTEKEFSIAEIKELVVNKERAEKFLGKAVYDDFVNIYNKPALSNQSKLLFTYEKFISTANKIVNEFPCMYADICNTSSEVGKYIYEKIRSKNKKITLWGFNICCFILYSLCETFGGLGGFLGGILWWAIWWFARKEYVKKITERSSKADKFVIYLKWSLILVAISLGVGLPLRMWQMSLI